jgi:hypothetical protein
MMKRMLPMELSTISIRSGCIFESESPADRHATTVIRSSMRSIMIELMLQARATP